MQAAAAGLTPKQVAPIFAKQAVRKFFVGGRSGEGKIYSGSVVNVEQDLFDNPATGQVSEELVFLIEYEDGDTEHVSLEEVLGLLVDPSTARAKLAGLQRRPLDAANLNGGSSAQAASAAALGTPAAPPADGLASREVTSQRQTKLTGGGVDHQGRRTGKRPAAPTGDDSGSDGGQQRKRLAATGARPSRLGLSLPDGAGASAAAPPVGGAEDGATPDAAGEGFEPVPLTPDGMRRVGLPGHLKSVELINFMNHEHMTMEFAPHVTFISGTNGSGKSATLQALQCCLGVKASKTGRAATGKGFIRTGASEAVVRVTLWNRPYAGHAAFQHAVYGDAITVERRIGAATQSWALKDAAGRKKAQRREDLDALLSALSLNAGNPITVMTQDTARSFLAGSSARADQEKYALYMEATQLGAIAESLLACKAQIAQMDEVAGKLDEEVRAMEARRGALAQAVASLEGVESWRKEQHELESVLVWAIVDEQAAAADVLQQQLDVDLPERRERAGREEGEVAREVAALTEATAHKAAFIEGFTASAARLDGETSAARAAAKDASRHVAQLQKRVAALERAAVEQTQRRDGLVAAVEEAAGEEAAAAQTVASEYAAQLGAAQSAQREAQRELAAAAAAHREAEAGSKAAEGALESVQRAERQAAAEVAALERDAASAKAAARGAGRDALLKFGGAAMVTLVAAVDAAVQARRFHAPPIGPIGRHLQLLDPRWGRAVEVAIGRDLHTFLVSDQHDCGVLNQLIARHGPQGIARPRVCVMRLDFPRHTIPPHHQPRSDVPTVLRVLSCTDQGVDAAVFNYLVDQARCEKAALGETRAACRQLADERGVAAALCVDGSKVYVRKQSVMFEPEPHQLHGKPPRLGTSSREAAQHLADSVDAARRELAEARRAVAQARGAADAASSAERDARRALAACRTREARAAAEARQLLTQLPPEVAATQHGSQGGGGDGEDALQRDIVAATQAAADYEGQADEVRAALEAARAAEAETAEALAAKQAEGRRLREESAEMAGAFEAEAAAKSAAEQRLAAARAELAELEAEARQKRAQLEACRANHAQLLETAPEICPLEEAQRLRAEAERRVAAKNLGAPDALAKFFTPGVLQQKVERLAKKVADAQRQAGGSLGELKEQLGEAEAELAGRGARAKQAVDVHAAMKAAHRRRAAKLKEVDLSVEQMVNARFNQFMRRKGHLGRIKLDRANKTLALAVQVGAGAVKDLKQLSGGERSFTTVAFTLALGSETSMPFRAMDEFDVFMDSVNRRVAMENLLLFARGQGELQFVFLTPQDVAAVESAREQCARQGEPIPDGFVTVVKMRPARVNAAQA